MKKLLVAAIVVLMASPAFAAIQNVKVSGDITSTYLDRQNFDLGMIIYKLRYYPCRFEKSERFLYPNPPSCGR